jgi:hypothetical protein
MARMMFPACSSTAHRRPVGLWRQNSCSSSGGFTGYYPTIAGRGAERVRVVRQGGLGPSSDGLSVMSTQSSGGSLSGRTPTLEDTTRPRLGENHSQSPVGAPVS